MQFESNRRTRQLKNSSTDGSVNSPFEFCVNFYTIPPSGKISLEDGEDMVTERLNLLRVCDEMVKSLENSSNFRRSKSYFETLENKLQNSDSKYDKNFYLASKSSSKSPEVTKARERDQISHFLLRIFYCRNEELKKWFISRECELLRARLMDKTNLSDLPKVLLKNGFVFQEVSYEEKNRFNDEIHWRYKNSYKKSVINQTVYKIPFEESADAVRNRRVFLSSGFAYIPIEDMISVICAKFRSELSHSLAILQKCLPQLEEDQRLIPRLNSLHSHHIQSRKNDNKSNNDFEKELVTPQMIDALSKESFPPCMRNIHEILRKEHHLKHYGRLHYGLFLKSIGLSLEDALNFFREEFTKKLAPEKFQKEYAYNIRYNYGKEGKKVIGIAFGCQKIINDNPPGPGDSHGCPFKHFDQNNLKQMLRRHQINEFDSQNILETVLKDNNYSKGCSMYFSCKHSGYPEINVYHPNQYYTESRRALKMSYLTPPESGQILSSETPHDMSLTAETTADNVMEESIFETEDEFDRSVATMDLENSIIAPNESNDNSS